MTDNSETCLNSATTAVQIFACNVPSPYREFVLLVGAAIVAWVSWKGSLYWLEGRALRLRTTRLKWLRQSLSKEKPLKCPALQKELEFQLAYGYAYDEDEIAFATARYHTSQRLHDIRYGKQHAQFDAKNDLYVERPSRWNLSLRLRIANYFLCGFAGLFVVGVPIGVFFSPVVGALLIFEAIVGFFVVADSIRRLTCAQRLCALTPESIRTQKDKGTKSTAKSSDEATAPATAVGGDSSTAADTMQADTPAIALRTA
jgi:hypothetical protein